MVLGKGINLNVGETILYVGCCNDLSFASSGCSGFDFWGGKRIEEIWKTSVAMLGSHVTYSSCGLLRIQSCTCLRAGLGSSDCYLHRRWSGRLYSNSDSLRENDAGGRRWTQRRKWSGSSPWGKRNPTHQRNGGHASSRWSCWRSYQGLAEAACGCSIWFC